jgi:hypothetical protein
MHLIFIYDRSFHVHLCAGVEVQYYVNDLLNKVGITWNLNWKKVRRYRRKVCGTGILNI